MLIAYVFEPLRALWPMLLALPWPIKLGLGASVLGLILILGSMIWERIEERENDKDLLDS